VANRENLSKKTGNSRRKIRNTVAKASLPALHTQEQLEVYLRDTQVTGFDELTTARRQCQHTEKLAAVASRYETSDRIAEA